jgi:N-acetyl-anhydromuramoyl-L-alanine amidase
MRISKEGIAEGMPFVASPNCDERPSATDIELIVVHAISLPPGEFGGPGIMDFFTNCLNVCAHPYYQTIADLRVSSHFLVRRDGTLFQFVATRLRAWHAGVSSWRGRERCNDFSIGIELEGCDEVPFEDAQYEALVRLTLALQERYSIADIVGHADIAPERKTDPGPHFDWVRYRRMLSPL